MSRIRFMGSDRVHEIRSTKERMWWLARIEERGLSYEYNKDGRDINIIVDDRGDPFFSKQKPSGRDT